jgi:hypothetical protein
MYMLWASQIKLYEGIVNRRRDFPTTHVSALFWLGIE